MVSIYYGEHIRIYCRHILMCNQLQKRVQPRSELGVGMKRTISDSIRDCR